MFVYSLEEFDKLMRAFLLYVQHGLSGESSEWRKYFPLNNEREGLPTLLDSERGVNKIQKNWPVIFI